MSLIVFILLVYGLCFLAADARIFGTDTTAYVTTLHGDVEPTEQDRVWVNSLGVIPLRQRLLRVRFIREHLCCYFCMGVWAGPLTHWIAMQMQNFGSPWQTQDYFLNHPNTGVGWFCGCVVAFLIGAAGSYVVNAFIVKLEEKN